MQTFLVALFVALASYAGADTWVDEDGDLFSAFVLHESYKLNPEAISVLDEN